MFIFYTSNSCPVWNIASFNGKWEMVFVFIALVNLAIAIAVNHWQGAWDSVVVILNWIYNIINVCELWFVFMVLIVIFKEKLLSDKNRN